MKNHFQPGNSVHHRFDRLVGGKQHFRCDVRHGDHLLDLFAFGIENMGESGLFQSHRLKDVGDGLFPGGCAGVITGTPIVIPAPLQRELSRCSCHSIRCGFKKSQSGLRAPYKKYLRSGACRNPDATDCSPPEKELFSQMQHSVTEKPVRLRGNESSSGYCE